MTATPVAQSKLTPEVIEAIATSLRVNPSWAAAADYAGITDKTLYRYRERATNHQQRRDQAEPSELSELDTHPDQPYWTAYQTWQTARSRGELELVAKIRQLGMEGDWRALHTLAKMGWPDRYSDRVELTGAGGGPVQISTDEARTQLEASLAQVKQKREAAGSGSFHVVSLRMTDDGTQAACQCGWKSPEGLIPDEATVQGTEHIREAADQAS